MSRHTEAPRGGAAAVVIPFRPGRTGSDPPRIGFRHLSPLVLPADGGSGDPRTLAYGAAHLPHHGALVLVCPKLLNLVSHLRAAQFTSERGVHRVAALRHYRHHDELWLHAPSPPRRLEVRIRGHVLECQVEGADGRLSGRRVLVTINRDDHPEQIADWAAHCVLHQGVESILLFDNGSTGYPATALIRVLDGVPGLGGGCVVSAPLPPGPQAAPGDRRAAEALDVGLLNLSRLSFLSRARSVLYCDVDDVPVSLAETLFDEVERSWLGLVTARSLRRVAEPHGARPARHGDHVLSYRPERQAGRKYAVRPASPLGQKPWDLHGAGGRLFGLFARSRGHRFYHCEGIGSAPTGASGLPVTVKEVVADAATLADYHRVGLRNAED